MSNPREMDVDVTPDIDSNLWTQTCAETVEAKPLTEQVDADLVVIGGGYTGISAALQAAKDGASVRLLEAKTLGYGGSGRNVGLCNAGLWSPPDEINRKIGVDAGERLSRILSSAPDVVFDLISKFNIACEPVRNGTLHCAHAPSGMDDLQNRHRQQAMRGAPVKLLDRDAATARVGSDTVFGALFDPRAGTIQPLSYAIGLARAAQSLGAMLHAGSPALDISKSAGHWHVKTPQGLVRTKNMIVATNGYAVPIKGLSLPKIIPVHYFQSATAPLNAQQRAQILVGQEGCWDTALVMSSWRMDAAGRLIIGGMGQLGHAGQSAHLAWLKRKLAKMFPVLQGVAFEHTWFGRIAMTQEYLPKTLMLDQTALIHFGYSGRGIGPGTVFGAAMAQGLLAGDMSAMPREPVAQHDISFAGVRQAYYETGATLTHLVKDRA